jgi:hypothetical protein
MNDDAISQTLEEKTAALMAIDGVVGVGEGATDSKPCVVVYVSGSAGSIRPKLGAVLGDCPFRMEPTDGFHAG